MWCVSGHVLKVIKIKAHCATLLQYTKLCSTNSLLSSEWLAEEGKIAKTKKPLVNWVWWAEGELCNILRPSKMLPGFFLQNDYLCNYRTKSFTTPLPKSFNWKNVMLSLFLIHQQVITVEILLHWFKALKNDIFWFPTCKYLYM